LQLCHSQILPLEKKKKKATKRQENKEIKMNIACYKDFANVNLTKGFETKRILF
jgi:hypothetical protein